MLERRYQLGPILAIFFCFVDLFSLEGPYVGPFFSERLQEGTHPGPFLATFLLFCGPFFNRRSMSWTYFLWMHARRYPSWVFPWYLFTVLWTFSHRKVHMLDLFSLNACKKVPTLDFFMLSFYCFVDLFSPVSPCHGPFLLNTKMVPSLDLFLLSFLLFCGPFLIKGSMSCQTFFLCLQEALPILDLFLQEGTHTGPFSAIILLLGGPFLPWRSMCWDLFSPDVCEKAQIMDLFLLSFCHVILNLFSPEGPCGGPLFSECLQEGSQYEPFADIRLSWLGTFSPQKVHIMELFSGMNSGPFLYILHVVDLDSSNGPSHCFYVITCMSIVQYNAAGKHSWCSVNKCRKTMCPLCNQTAVHA